MSDRLNEFRGLRDDGMEPGIWVAVAFSLVVHVAVLWGLPRMRLPSLDNPEWSDASRSLSVKLVPLDPPPAPPPSTALRARPPSAFQARPPAVAPPRSAPPAIALKQPAAKLAAPARPPVDGDLSSYIESKRRARAEPALSAPAASVPVAPSVQDDDARRDRIAAANLRSQGAPVFGYDPRRKGGAFQIQRMGDDDAEFIFYGWDKDARRNLARLIEVTRGINSDIRVAVVRRIIAIIRDHEQEDFLWESSRLGRSLTLSARARDNAGLEEFMLHEFFNDPRLSR